VPLWGIGARGVPVCPCVPLCEAPVVLCRVIIVCGICLMFDVD
jgi:hypothetical protein